LHRVAWAGEILLRIGGELRHAARRAEVVRLALVLDAPGGARRIDTHAANGIDRHDFKDMPMRRRARAVAGSTTASTVRAGGPHRRIPESPPACGCSCSLRG